MLSRAGHRQAANRRGTVIALVVLGLLAVVPVTAVVRRDSAGAATAQPGDGTTTATAGASCWGIKQQFPTSADGTYWLSTATLDRPGQYYCDMTTAGGGWVLVGRGRDGWTFATGGQGSPTTLRTSVDGPDAFAPAALSTTVVNGLLNGAAVSSLPDGVRLERAMNSAGTSRQDYRLLFSGTRTWTWSLPAGQLLAGVRIDGTSYSGSNTQDTSKSVPGQSVNGLNGDTSKRRLYTSKVSNKDYVQGFGTGSVNGGSSSSTNYLWTAANEGSPLPFTRVWVRPQIANQVDGYTPIPASGFPAQPLPPALKERSEVAPFGVVGYNHDNEEVTTPWKNNVNVLKVYGDRVFVGGRFTGVQQGPNGTPDTQGSLAAFDLNGNYISSFDPKIDGRVWDMTRTTDGKLIIGGDFTSVDGLPNTTGLAALDPNTGEVITSWKATLARVGSTDRPIVRSLDSKGDWVYAGGRFNRVTGGTWNQITVSSAISLKASNGTPGTWKPQINASAIRIRASEDGTRVYLAGYFNAVNGDTNHGYHAITDLQTGAPVPGIGAWQPSSASAHYQQAVAENGDRILVGGSEHDFQMYDRNRTTLLDSTITKAGGDTQAIEKIGDYVYIGCHCMDWIYQGTNNWTSPSGFRAVDPIRIVGRFEASTLTYDTTWVPGGLKGINDEGIWSVSGDSRGCIWVGGDLVRGAYSGNAATDWLGGFARFCPDDSTPPTTPGQVKATVGTGTVALSWGASGDDSGAVSYDVYRNDRIIATVSGTTFTDTTENGATGRLTYTVRASDPRGNRSASPAPTAVNGPAVQIGTPVAYGATWKYLDSGSDQGSAWRDAGFDDGSWSSGPAVLGWGGGENTTIGASKPVTTYFRRSFDVADASQVKILQLEAKFTQGAVVYVNGTEVGRWNMPSGAITSATVASGYVGGTDDATAKVFKVPGSLLQNGANSIAVEVHGWRAGSGKVFLDLQASLRGANGDTTPPTAPTATAVIGSSGVDLTWTAATDEDALGGYAISRAGTLLAVVTPTTTSWRDPVAADAPPADYVVRAFDLGGNGTDSQPATSALPTTTTTSTTTSTTTTTTEPTTTTTAPPADPNILAFGSTWRFSYPDTAPAASWKADGYDDSTWASGPGILGFGDPKVVTAITANPAPRPLTSYYRATVNVTDPSRFSKFALDLVRNGGAAVYVNGVEVARDNLPAGTLTGTTYALTAPSAATRWVPVHVEIPASAFRAGSNTIAIELHLNYKSQPTAGTDLKITGIS